MHFDTASKVADIVSHPLFCPFPTFSSLSSLLHISFTLCAWRCFHLLALVSCPVTLCFMQVIPFSIIFSVPCY